MLKHFEANNYAFWTNLYKYHEVFIIPYKASDVCVKLKF